MKNFTNTKPLSSRCSLTNYKQPLRQILRGAVNLSLLLALTAISWQVVSAATFEVNTVADSGTGSLRQAILNANADSVQDTITFNLPPPQMISPLTQLPTITQPVIVNGYSQPGATANTLAVGDNASLQVGLDGGGLTNMPSTASFGLRISAGNCVVSGLIITRFQEAGIRIDAGTGSSVVGNFIGANIFGDAGFGNLNRGILIVGSTGNFIGDATPAGRNVIYRNFGTGISITGGGSATIRGNYIGTDKNGTADLGNTQDGIRIVDSSNSTVGGATAAERNVISGNESHGIFISQGFGTSATGNVIKGNYIGVNANGGGQTVIAGFSTSIVGNSGSGVVINAAGNTVGGSTVGERNVISGNRASGVALSTNFATGNIVSGNFIGTDAVGTGVIGNRDNGVQISNLAADNTIGGTSATGACSGECNVIANNGSPDATTATAGVYLDTTARAGNAIRANRIFGNLGTGIDLGTKGDVAADRADAGDADTGANNLQNPPVLTSANDAEFIGGTLNSTTNTSFAVDFYMNDANDGTMSEGRTFIGTMIVQTDNTGGAVFNFNTSVALTVGQFVTATATPVNLSNTRAAGDSDAPQGFNDTSEFSNAQNVAAAPPTAATVTVGGRVNESGRSLRSVAVELFEAASGRRFYATTDASGAYRFTEIPVGADYIITPQKLGYTFNPTSKFVSLTEELTDVDFVGIQDKKPRRR